ncbi:hypothetical protein [Frateuria aurantia]|uniref:DUF551 domain-containing protein n=1 Tax=Frateuria aurantia (strain ATCC 33424 / DSM 6220 / KCTC 2777 / LMG 1558 / NBRC 3245 / NCIMB 13370) TaxID=767434 RepID=H8L5X1_FRAAD|nr:hypothetical protein [Frateuria aurantia]AFC85873.1 hypothetical protein Fraau_1450 [Frateuria aurantia DSM 6220]
MSTEQKVIALRDEFEDHARYMALEGREVDLNWQTWKAAHAKYAPRWLPIDGSEKAAGNVILGQLTLAAIYPKAIAGWDDIEECWKSPNGKIVSTNYSHYMPIPDAPEVG